MIKKIVDIVACLLLLASCSSDEKVFEQQGKNESVRTITSLTAKLGGETSTRLHIINGTQSGNKRLGWQQKDEIEVYSDLNHDTRVYSITGIDESETTARFTGDAVTGNTFYAFFPEGSTRTAEEMINVDEDNYLLLRVNYDNSYTAHPFSDEDFFTYAPMVAISNGNEFNFKQTTGMVHFSVAGLEKIGRVIFRGNNSEPLLGQGYIDLSEAEPKLVIDQGATTMQIYNVTEDGSDAIHIYFCIPPTTFTKGFTLEIWPENDANAGNHIVKTFSEQLTVGRAEVKTFSTIDVNQHQEPPTEARVREILGIIYDALGGDNWKNNTNWKTNAPLSEWYGLGVDENGHLTSIEMWNNNLVGAVPEEIGELSTLTYLAIFGYGQITSLPNTIGNLTYLEYLNIADIPIKTFPEWVYKLKNLRTLRLQDCQIAGNLPERLAEMSQLTFIDLRYNEFIGEIPTSYFTNLVNLHTFELYGNKLSGTITLDMQQSPMWQSLESKGLNPQADGYVINIEGAVMKIELNMTEVTLKVGETAQLEVVAVLPTNAINKNTYWYGYDYYNDIATIDDNGLITAFKEGRAWVYCYASDENGAVAQCHVIVVPATEDDNSGSFEDFHANDLDWK
ncbi:MAG: Ig-like domain-containing protein [Bacteroidaceae bacterium]|nr:Ig-like domain-containing protein [Bacteroidaceae bacterium]